MIYDGLRRGKTVLLAGPTGTGKTLAVEEVAQQMPDARLVRIEGKEGLLDVDFLGNIVPREDQRVWQDGPLAEAIQSAQCDPVIARSSMKLTRFPREQINLLIGFLNRKSGDLCRQEGLERGRRRAVLCGACAAGQQQGLRLSVRSPADRGRGQLRQGLRRVSARSRAAPPLHDGRGVRLSAARRRRSICWRARTGLDRKFAEALVAVAIESRRVHENGDLPGQIDTASLIEWGAQVCRVRSAHRSAGDGHGAR